MTDGFDLALWEHQLKKLGYSHYECQAIPRRRQGWTNEEIAEDLGILEEDVERVIDSAKRKAGRAKQMYLCLMAPGEFWENVDKYPELKEWAQRAVSFDEEIDEPLEIPGPDSPRGNKP